MDYPQSVVNENITISLHDGEIWHMCEHDTDILYTSAFKMAELYRFIQICLHGTSKKSIDFSPLLFSGGQSINQSIHEYLLCSENVPGNEI